MPSGSGGGGLLQLVSCSDNKLLIDNLNFSHFKLVYKTAHPFSFQDLNINTPLWQKLR